MSPKLDAELLSVLACPRCKNELALGSDEQGLICEACRLVYPVRKGVPVMLVEEAIPLQGSKSQNLDPDITSGFLGERIVLLIVEGKGKGEKIELDPGTCRAVGRSLDETERTKIFNVDSAITLDEASKKLVMQYVSKMQTKGMKKKESMMGGADLGGFTRGADFQLRDTAVSRLHAMLFCDESGSIGILDLVSKNGTFVNGVEVESKMLKKGDLITLGGAKIRFEV